MHFDRFPLQSIFKLVKPEHKWVPQRAVLLGLLAFAAIALSGCLTILPQWQPTDEIEHQTMPQVLNDSNPIVVQSGQERFILFIGDTTDGDVELFLQRMNAAGQLVGSPAQLTTNTGEDSQPQLAEQDGWLYLVWRYRHTPSDPYTILWARVNTAMLAYAAGPVQVNGSLTGDGHTPQLAVRPGGETVVVWEQRNGITGTIYYRQVNFDGTFASAPVTVSQGTGCAPAGYHQRAPRVTRSFAFGTYAQIAWIGNNAGGDDVYWRELNNSSSSPSSNCLILSDAVNYAGLEIDLDMAINPFNNRSYVAWTHLNDGSNDRDVYFRSVGYSFPPQRCDILNVSNAVTTTSEGGVRIAAGHGISNWVHLVWERFNQTAGQGAIRYALIQDGANCAVSGQKTPTKITPSGNLSLSGAPVPSGADVDSPRIAVARNAIISRYNGGSGSTLMMSAQADAEAPPVESAAEAGAEATVPDERPTLPAGVAHGASETEAQNDAAPAPALNCAATPDHPRCQELAALAESNGRIGPLSSQATAASSFQCGSNAADAIVVSFFDDTNKQMYAALFQAGEVLNGSSCDRVVSAQYPGIGGLKLQKLTRSDYQSPDDVDRDDHYPFISARGLPTVAWRGREPTSVFSAANEEIYVAEGKFETYAPIVRRP
jgi:hypothetical protein